MKILVTGASGFLGGELVMHASRKGYEVYATGRNAKLCERLAPFTPHIFTCELANANQLNAHFPKVEAVVHCAALSTPWAQKKDYEMANIIVTQNLLQACLQNGVRRFIYISTPSIYMSHDDRVGIEESEALPNLFLSEYARTKYVGESNVEKAAAAGLETIILRPQGIIGIGDTSILPRILRANTKRGIPLINEGKALIDLTAVENVVHAILLSLHAPKACLSQAYNISNEEPYTIFRLLSTVFAELEMPVHFRKVPYRRALRFAQMVEAYYRFFSVQKEPPITAYAVMSLGKSRTLNIDKARRLLGYEPQIGVNETLSKYIDWWKKHEARA